VGTVWRVLGLHSDGSSRWNDENRREAPLLRLKVATGSASREHPLDPNAVLSVCMALD
jgi:hypothetical protein